MSGTDAKVFGIGLRKTGTRSIAAACRTLGYRTLHKGGDETSDAVLRAEQEGAPLAVHLGHEYEAYFDVEALVHRFAALDEQYPGSRFILSTRDEERWLASLERHVRANQVRRDEGRYNGSLLEVEPDRWRAEWAEHHAAVRSYFADRPGDLLEIDVCEAGEGWDLLAPFLDRPIPAEPFPWENRKGEGTYAASAAGRALGKRLRYLRARISRSTSR